MHAPPPPPNIFRHAFAPILGIFLNEPLRMAEILGKSQDTRTGGGGELPSQHDVMLLHKAKFFFDYLILTRGGGSPVEAQVIWRGCPSVSKAT